MLAVTSSIETYNRRGATASAVPRARLVDEAM
jgi:hypothetical protein